MFEERPAQEIRNFQTDNLERVGVHEIRFCEHRHSMLNVKHPADIEVLASLRLDAFIGSDDQKDEINSADSGEHVAHEAFVAGNVHEAEADGPALGAGQFEMSKPQINR